MTQATAPLGASAAPTLPTPTTDADLANMARHSFDALLTQPEVTAYEASTANQWGTSRRIALVSLTRSKAELVAGFSQGDNGPELLMEMVEQVYAWRDHLKNHIELAGMASARLIVACSTLICNGQDTAKGLAKLATVFTHEYATASAAGQGVAL